MANPHFSEQEIAVLRAILATHRLEPAPLPVGMVVLSVIAWTSAGIAVATLLIRFAISLAT
ncbi:MAG: hypothetical protein OXU53_02095 [Deltaproteobacteria bacterium]|nr:hypothetical protein [Deltaproteobacteria bacterium]